MLNLRYPSTVVGPGERPRHHASLMSNGEQIKPLVFWLPRFEILLSSASIRHQLGAAVNEVAIHKRLAAIVAADMVGFSRLMEADETGTLDQLRQLRQELLDPVLVVPAALQNSDGEQETEPSYETTIEACSTRKAHGDHPSH